MPTPQKRDNFSNETIKALKERAAYICSNPICKKLTVAPSLNSENHVEYMGEAAHITGAIENSPRYDTALTSAQRRSITNAIFLCSNCATIIDKNNGADYTIETLKQWKLRHEEWVHSNLNRNFAANSHEIMKAAVDASLTAGIVQEIMSMKDEFVNADTWDESGKIIERLYNYDEHRSVLISKQVFRLFSYISHQTRPDMHEDIGSSIESLSWQFLLGNISDEEVLDYSEAVRDCLETGCNIVYDAFVYNKNVELAYYGCSIMRIAYQASKRNNLQPIINRCNEEFQELFRHLSRDNRPDLEEGKKMVHFVIENLEGFEDLSMRMDSAMHTYVFG